MLSMPTWVRCRQEGQIAEAGWGEGVECLADSSDPLVTCFTGAWAQSEGSFTAALAQASLARPSARHNSSLAPLGILVLSVFLLFFPPEQRRYQKNI